MRLLQEREQLLLQPMFGGPETIRGVHHGLVKIEQDCFQHDCKDAGRALMLWSSHPNWAA